MWNLIGLKDTLLLSDKPGHHHQELDVSLIDIAYSFFHENYDKGGDVRGRRHLRDELSDLKIKALEFHGNLNAKNYLDWCKQLKGSSNSRSIMTKMLSSWPSLR